MTYDLTNEPWIPVLIDGAATERSLRSALLDAAQITSLAATPVTMGPALLRHLLLAVVLDSVGPPRSKGEWKQRWDAGALDGELVEGYLDQHRDRFDLFSDIAPFAQVADLQTPAGDFKPASVLIPSIPGGNSTPLFGSRTDAEPVVLDPAEAARWLVHALAWDTAGIKSGAVGDEQAKGGKSYGNPVGLLGQIGVVLPVGRSLFETVMLNLPIVPDGLQPDDAPHWRRPPVGPSWSRRAPSGLLDLFTWLSRRVRLVTETVDGHPAVRQVVLAAGDQVLSLPDFEPHTSWWKAKNPKVGEPEFRPIRHRSDKASWQGLGSLLSLPSSESAAGTTRSALLEQVAELHASGTLHFDYPLSVALVGCEYGTQSAVIDNVVSDELPLPVAALAADLAVGEVIDDVALSAGALVDAINILHGDLRRAAGGDPVPWNRGQRPGTVLVQRLDPHARRLLSGLQREPERADDARMAWGAVVEATTWALAEELLTSVPPSARPGREVEVGGRERTFRAASAELSFRRRLRSALDPFVEDRLPTEEVG